MAEITDYFDTLEDDLEDLLIYDDLFLDYFNSFLQHSAFPQPYAYNRLTGTIEEASLLYRENSFIFTADCIPSSPFEATEREKDKIITWVKQERLPLFWRSALFRELKLCKLLLKPLDYNRQTVQTVGGYSRQTETSASSLSNSEANTDHDTEFDAWEDIRLSAYFKYQRPGSNAFSIPPSLDVFELGRHTVHTARTMQTSKQRVKTSTAPQASEYGETTLSIKTARDVSSFYFKSRTEPGYLGSGLGETQRARIVFSRDNLQSISSNDRGQSAPVIPDDRSAADGGSEHNDEDDDRLTALPEDDFGELSLTHPTLQNVKEKMISTFDGMQMFKSFLGNAPGGQLLKFWLDCENFRDTLSREDGSLKRTSRKQFLFKEMMDKHKLMFTQDVKESLYQVVTTTGIEATLFLSAQYNALRRLRTYWLPRYIIHSMGQYRDDSRLSMTPMNSLPLLPPIMPSLEVSRSLAVNPFQLKHVLGEQSWDDMLRSGLQPPTRESSLILKRDPTQSAFRNVTGRILISFLSDDSCGGPFERYLRRFRRDLLHWFHFWRDVTEYSIEENRRADRLLRIQLAWDIFNTYLDPQSSLSIGVAEEDAQCVYQALMTARDHVKASVFEPIKKKATEALCQAWIEYVREDVGRYTNARLPGEDEFDEDATVVEMQPDRPSTSKRMASTVTYTPEVSIEGDRVVVRRPWVRGRPESTTRERQLRLHSALLLAEDISKERLDEWKKEREERRKIMEKERRKAIRAAKKRLKKGKERPMKDPVFEMNGPMKSSSTLTKEVKEQKPINFVNLQKNRNVMLMFKHHFKGRDPDGELSTTLQLYQDVASYKEATSSSKKAQIAQKITKTYFDDSAKKKLTDVSPKIRSQLLNDKQKSKSPAIEHLEEFSAKKLEEEFLVFWTDQMKQIGVDPNSTDPSKAVGSQRELIRKVEELGQSKGIVPPPAARDLTKNRTSMLGTPEPRRPASADERKEFLTVLQDAIDHGMSVKMIHFHAYCMRHGESENLQWLDKDLLFYIETKKFKDYCHSFSNDVLLREKLAAIMECYVDSPVAPPLQIDVPHELASRILKAYSKFRSGKEVDPKMFDDAQNHLFRELVQFWAAFCERYQEPRDPKQKLVTRTDKLLQDRLAAFESWQAPKREIFFPDISTNRGTANVIQLTFSLGEGLKFKESAVEEGSVVNSRLDSKVHRSSIVSHSQSDRFSRVNLPEVAESI